MSSKLEEGLWNKAVRTLVGLSQYIIQSVLLNKKKKLMR